MNRWILSDHFHVINLNLLVLVIISVTYVWKEKYLVWLDSLAAYRIWSAKLQESMKSKRYWRYLQGIPSSYF